MFSINYAFAFPYFSFDFTNLDNLVSALIMATISLITSALITKLKRWQAIKTPTVLEELIDSVIFKFKKRYPRQSVDIDIPDDIATIPMDAILIEQVLVNLLENAVQHAIGMTCLALKVFVLDVRAIFEVADEEIKLTQTEYNIVAFLSEHSRKVMTYSAIIKAIWREGKNEFTIKKLQVNMASIRKKFGARPGEVSYIVNELGVGYRMDA